DLGWGNSPAAAANPKLGLVIHYDGSNQNLAAKDHSACINYWKNTRSFHTGPARGWADIGYCVDEETEILTTDGWKTFREIAPGDPALTLTASTGPAPWQRSVDVCACPGQPRAMHRTEGRTHSSRAAARHRWPLERFCRGAGKKRTRNPGGTWAATGTGPRNV